ncbi:MAG: M1 family metallopeptidase [Niabella sp.]
MKKGFFAIIILIALSSCAGSQQLAQRTIYTQQDSLRGSIGVGRDWWDVKKYDIHVAVNIPQKTISGFTDITYSVTIPGNKKMQIDLQEPMLVTKVENLSTGSSPVTYSRDGNVYWLTIPPSAKPQKNNTIRIYFEGKPRTAVTPPWDGGWIWKTDSLGRPFISVACQGLGASVWYPCKDHQSDEPDNGASLTITVPNELTAVGNGKLAKKQNNPDGTISWQWEVKNPINNYLITPYIGYYKNFTDEFKGEKGKLELSYWVLDYNLEKAKKHFEIVKPMLGCFENWMGPYPFYEDSYKIVEAPHLGMEHQSAIAYGNDYLNGYHGKDRSGSGWGLNWDFIIVHESGHEWFANNITAKDIADMWIHEAFTTYSETLMAQCINGLKAANEYIIGQRRNIRNDKPIIGHYGINEEGSSDMYDKGANMLHTIRQVINNDTLFKELLRGLGKDFYHQTVTTKQIEDYINKKTGKSFNKVFDQYLRTTKIPVLEYKKNGSNIAYRWANCVNGFNMPVKLTNGKWLYPTEQFQKISGIANFEVNPNFYITVRQIQ